MISLLPYRAQRAIVPRFECASLDIPQPVTVNDLIPDVIYAKAKRFFVFCHLLRALLPRGAELRRLAYTRALQREFRCTSINRVCSELPALQKGQPKLPPPARTLAERGLMRIDRSPNIPRLFFTGAGMVALRQMMGDRRFVDPVKFAHVRRELGIDPSLETKAAE